MLRANLSTRPFYNERAVHLLLGVAAVLALAFTVVNVSQIVSLSRERTTHATQADDAEARAAQLREAAQRTRQSLDAARLQAVSASAQEANAVIDRRLFSWTALFNHFETTLPADVRITSVRPKTDIDGTIVIAITVVSRSVEDVDEFMIALEDTGVFTDVLSRDERSTEEGTLLSVLETRYEPAQPSGRATAGPADEQT
jgi:Tfp pilus assembly protein PilN